jgi:arginine/lysine/ornithine decarboxylase
MSASVARPRVWVLGGGAWAKPVGGPVVRWSGSVETIGRSTAGGTLKLGPLATTYQRTPDHARAPMVESIVRYRNEAIAPFSTPGHKQGVGIDPHLRELFGEPALLSDIPVSGGADDLHFTWGTLRQAEDLGADAWGADRTFYLVNGSSTGNHAFLLAMLQPGDEVVVARDIHKSLLVALIYSGARPIYVAPRLHPDLDIGLGVDDADVAATLDAHPNAKLVALVSPSYCGVSSDLAAIAEVAHARGVPVYVDEAWGPHFHFHPALPASAMASGVDGAVASTHKVLGAITQSAILNLKGPRVDARRVETAVGMAQTTSPAAYILASIDACRRQMALHGQALLDRTIALADEARLRLQRLPGINVLYGDRLGVAAYDLTKLVIDVHGLGLTGFQVEEILRRRFRIVPEMSDLTGIMCLITIGDTEESIDRLVHAFEELSLERKPHLNGNRAIARSSGVAVAPGVQAMSPREAFYAPARTIPLIEAIGEVSAELVIPYPPGIPVLAPGDVISPEKVEYLAYAGAHGTYMSGASDSTLATIRVVAE